MDIMDLYAGFNMLAGWSMYAVLDHYFLNERRRLSSWHLLGFIGAFQFCTLILDYSIAYWGGYLAEQIGLYQMDKLYLSLLLIELILALFITGNLLSRFRNNQRLRKIQLGLIVLYLIGHLAILGIRPFGYATTVLPGWHSTIMSLGSLLGTIFWLAIYLTLGMVDRFTYPSKEQ